MNIMPRIKVEIPAKISFSVTLPVRISDINYGNHLGYDAMVNLIHEARILWLKQGGFTELKIENYSLIMADLAIEFKAEGFHGDALTIEISIGELGRSNFDVYYSIKNQNETLIAKAKTGMICFDYHHKKVVSITETFKAFLLK